MEDERTPWMGFGNIHDDGVMGNRDGHLDEL